LARSVKGIKQFKTYENLLLDTEEDDEHESHVGHDTPIPKADLIEQN